MKSQIKTYIDQKQNVREGFKETFQPLIESQDKVKASIDKEQNGMIKQLQENQLALTEGLDKNRLAITSGFDKLDEVKRWDLSQLPGLEAFEDDENVIKQVPALQEKEGDKLEYKISNRDLNKIIGFDLHNEDLDAFCNEKDFEDLLKRNNFYEEKKYDIVETYSSPILKKIELVPKIENDPLYKISVNDYFRLLGQENRLKEDGEKEIKEVNKSELNRNISENFNQNKYDIDIDENSKIVQIFEKKSLPISKYDENEINKFWDKEDEIRLKFYKLALPSAYKDKSLEEIQKVLDNGLKEVANLKRSFSKSVVNYVVDSDTGLLKAEPAAKIRPNPKTVRNTQEYNTLIKFNKNMRKLRKYKKLLEKKGSGIIHFNNPLQLLDRLELLAGSIFAGNNGVKQEFSQIAHLLHQLKVITKKQLNDLFKKYIY